MPILESSIFCPSHSLVDLFRVIAMLQSAHWLEFQLSDRWCHIILKHPVLHWRIPSEIYDSKALSIYNGEALSNSNPNPSPDTTKQPQTITFHHHALLLLSDSSGEMLPLVFTKLIFWYFGQIIFASFVQNTLFQQSWSWSRKNEQF